MAERLRAAAVGYALVDQKIFDNDPVLPDGAEDTNAYLASRPYLESAGGSVATTVAAYQKYTDNPTRLFYSIADDKRGERFFQETGEVLGLPRVISKGHTGFCVLAIDEDGEIADEITVYGVAPSVEIPRGEKAEKNDLVISNVNTLRNERVLEQTGELLNHLDKRRGIFAFRLSGAHDLLASTHEAREAVDSLPVNPDIVFGNAAEASNLLEHDDHERAVHQLLPDSRILVLTRGALDAIVRYEGEIMHIPVPQPSLVVDVTGAGDHLMGVALGELMQHIPQQWTAEKVRRSVSIGMLAASRIIQTTDSRLSKQDLIEIKGGHYG